MTKQLDLFDEPTPDDARAAVLALRPHAELVERPRRFPLHFVVVDRALRQGPDLLAPLGKGGTPELAWAAALRNLREGVA